MGRKSFYNEKSGSGSGSATITQAEKDAIVAEAKRGGVFIGSYTTVASMPTTGTLSGDYATLSAQDGTNSPGDYTWLDLGFGAQWFPKTSTAVSNGDYKAKGDLISAIAPGVAQRIGVGADGQVLTADAAQATGLKWSAPASASGTAGTVTAAGAYTIANDRIYVNPTATLATWAPTMPAGTDGQVVEIYFGGTLATGTVVVTATWPSTILGAGFLPTEWMAGEAISFRFSSATGKWHGMS